MKYTRNVSLEMVRIVAMWCIVIHHCVLGPLNVYDLTVTNEWNCLMMTGTLINCFAVVGVNLFFLLTGYFNSAFSWKKWFQIVCIFYLYSGLIQLVGLFLGKVSLGLGMIKSIIYPFSNYWFMAVYVILMFSKPLLNLIIDTMIKEMYVLYTVGIRIIFV